MARKSSKSFKSNTWYMNVFEAALKRIDFVFKEFDNVYVSFSGGKDSGVLLNLCLYYMKEHKLNKKLRVFHIDYECQYSMTTDYVQKVFKENSNLLEIYHCCVPFKVTTCTSMYQSYWRPWEEGKKDIWVREMPKNTLQYKDFPFFKSNLWDYDFQELFGMWLHEKVKAKNTCCLVGIRTQESLNRWRAIYSDRNYKNYNNIQWTKKYDNGIVNAYPIFDWQTQDIWVANAKMNWSYNKLYDLYYMAGLDIGQMRVASPFISEGQETLRLYKAIEPDLWGRMIGRVNGVNFTSIYGGTTTMGWKNIKLPKGHTWESFMYFLLKTLPKETRENYINKLETSIKFWKEKGGCLSKETIQKLRENNINISVEEKTNYKTNKLPVKMNYLDDIDISEFKELPTYKRMCICIIKNDHLCKYMGFSQTKNEIIRRKNIMNKYKNLL
jgi:predicted phosphoadenosine phosphosulfate sulfurtransferase